MTSRSLSALALAASFAFAPLGLAGQDAVPESPQRGPTDPAELETFVDGLMFGALKEFNTAGGVVAVVKDGEVFFAKGYGYSDWEARAPVDPETTLFRIGSVSKLFVWTSVMQMVEEGLLDLDTDINEYLDFEIPPTFEEPVTLADIMGHAAGFEDYVLELFGDDQDRVA
jgi:CubicO group peptidase (beta-lactamase class C family)